MNTTTTTRRVLADAELRQADPHTRAFSRRVYELMNLTGCSLPLALQAVAANDERLTKGAPNDHAQ